MFNVVQYIMHSLFMHLDVSERIKPHQGLPLSILIFEFLCTKYFQKTSCLITADGNNNAKINLERLKGYLASPPFPVEI